MHYLTKMEELKLLTALHIISRKFSDITEILHNIDANIYPNVISDEWDILIKENYFEDSNYFVQKSYCFFKQLENTAYFINH